REQFLLVGQQGFGIGKSGRCKTPLRTAFELVALTLLIHQIKAHPRDLVQQHPVQGIGEFQVTMQMEPQLVEFHGGPSALTQPAQPQSQHRVPTSAGDLERLIAQRVQLYRSTGLKAATRSLYWS